VERSTRVVIVLHPPGDHRTETVKLAMAAKIQTLPEQLRRSITWDRGSKMCEHVRFSVETNVDLYLCDPHSPWQRGSNERTRTPRYANTSPRNRWRQHRGGLRRRWRDRGQHVLERPVEPDFDVATILALSPMVVTLLPSVLGLSAAEGAGHPPR
jgi:hypothetical protein